MEKAKAVQNKDDSKVTYSAGSILHKLIAGCFPKTSELSTNQYGELSVGPNDMIMNTIRRQKQRLPPVGPYRSNISMAEYEGFARLPRDRMAAQVAAGPFTGASDVLCVRSTRM